MKDIQRFIDDVRNESDFARDLDIFELTDDEKFLANALLDEIDHYRRRMRKFRKRYYRQLHLKKR